VLEKIVDKPLRIRGIALTAGMSRNMNIYLPEELEAFASRLVSTPVYIEHVAVPNAVGKVVNAHWDGQNLWYEAEIYDDEVAEKIRKGLIRHVSIGADYEQLDVVDGKIPRGLHNAELSLVAVPGIPEANIQIVEKLTEQGGEPIAAGEYILGFYQDLEAFLPKHFSTVWLTLYWGYMNMMAGAAHAKRSTVSSTRLELRRSISPTTRRSAELATWTWFHVAQPATIMMQLQPESCGGLGRTMTSQASPPAKESPKNIGMLSCMGCPPRRLHAGGRQVGDGDGLLACEAPPKLSRAADAVHAGFEGYRRNPHALSGYSCGRNSCLWRRLRHSSRHQSSPR